MPRGFVDPAIAVIHYFRTAPIETARTTMAIAKDTLNARSPKPTQTVAQVKKPVAPKAPLKKPVKPPVAAKHVEQPELVGVE